MSQLCACSGTKQPLSVLAADGELLATVDSDTAVFSEENSAYLQLAVDQAAAILADKRQLDEEKAKKELYRGGYTIHTAFDAVVSEQLTVACDGMATDVDAAAVITDTQGYVCAVYSNAKDGSFATTKYPPCSAIKPISVYAPALEKGTIDWFTGYEDSPYSYLTAADGSKTPWPSNANNVYRNEKVLMAQAVRESTNTIAVKCLADYGVANSIAFMEDNFGITLETEKAIMAQGGPDEIIGNIALGSLVDGVSPVDMAGYYQVFANGGFYQAPQAVVSICDRNGEEMYTADYAPVKVLKRTTSATMNYLLQEVVTATGTGKNAHLKGVTVAGKTGTDDDNKNNWFVAVTPDYCCAFWHGKNSKNITTDLFAAAMTAVYEQTTRREADFPHLRSVRQVAYCPESGKRYTASCPSIEMGYYSSDQELSRCDMH